MQNNYFFQNILYFWAIDNFRLIIYKSGMHMICIIKQQYQVKL
jgi:hypothetical protein